MQNRVVKAIVYPLFFLVCLVFFLIQGFPVSVIGDLAIREADQKLGVQMSIGDIGMLFPNGVEASNVRFIKQGEDEELPMTLRVDEVAARISLFSLLAGDKDVSFSSDLLGGSAEGDFSLSGNKWSLYASLDGVSLSKVNFWADMIGQELTGKLSGEVELNVDTKDIKATRGSIVFDLVQGQVGQGKVYGVKVPWVSLGKTQANVDIQKGKAEIKTLKVSSDDIEVSLDGYFLLQQKFEHISSHCRLRFKPSEEKLTEVRNQIPQEFRGYFDAELNKAKGKDGFYRYSIFGRLFGGRPQFRPLRQ